MLFTIRASGSLGNPPDLGKKAYRLPCRFRIEAYPPPAYLSAGARKAAERFVRDMHTQGFEYVERFRPRLTGPYPHIMPMTIRRTPELSAREMLPMVLQGARFRATGHESIAQNVIPAAEAEYWDYELSLVFVRNTLLIDVPARHEERTPL